MDVKVFANSQQVGMEAAVLSARILNECIERNGKARMIVSTGASQFDFFQSIITLDIDWSKVEVFHLDEYVGLPETHPASFRKYVKERFLSHVNIQKVHFVGDGDINDNIQQLSAEITKEPIDLALIGIGVNAHIAFNDPPANFTTKESFIIVDLDEQCKQQQVGEGWFASVEDVPMQAITMTVHQIMLSKAIVSCVPSKVKARAVRLALEDEVTANIPASILKTHANFTLFLDQESASEIEISRFG